MRLSWSVVFLLSFAACERSVGGPCSTSDEVSCKSPTEAWACVGGAWAAVPCGGPRGCGDAPAFNCDTQLATSGQACPPWAQGRTACQSVPSALLTCLGPTWQQSSACGTCSIANGAPECRPSGTGGGGGTTGGGGGTTGGGGGTTGGGGGTTGGGGGTTGGGGGTTGGGGGSTACGPGNCTGCCKNGQCIPPPVNAGNNLCGTGGNACDDCGARGLTCLSNLTCGTSTTCNPTTCPAGCCTNGQCVPAPLNSTNDFCGTGGRTCSNCTNLGLVCTAATFTCNQAAGTGGGTGGGGATGGGGGATDPCQGIAVGGQCVSTSLVRYCSIPTGNGSPSVQTYQCPGGSTCQATGAGAACVQTGSCRAGDTRCTSPTTAQVCSSSGSWGTAQTCPGGAPCIASSVGVECGIAPPTTTLTGTLLYQTRNPNQTLSDWASPILVPGRNVLVVSQRGSDWIDATTTNLQGQFTIKVPSSPITGDVVMFAAFGGDGLGMRYAVIDPNLGMGTFSPGDTGANPRYWSWSRAVTTLSNGGTVAINTTDGSGALNLYDSLQGIWASSTAANQGRQGNTISMWLGLGTEWSCGACFSESGGGFETSIWMPGGATDQGYWSDYTIAHELGHWQMRSYGTSPNEGGTHILSCPTFPGQAWSEGYATWHAAAVRNTSFLEDKQGGGFFWFDISTRKYWPLSSGEQSITGIGSSSLAQLQAQVDENAVAALLWTISSSRPTGTQEVFQAIASPHMNTTPWPRGYTRRTWDVGSNCSKTNVVDTRQPSLHLADVLDALSCGGSPAQSNRVPTATMLRACSDLSAPTNNAYYPYPVNSPLCRAGYCYGCRSGTTCSAGNVATACGTGGVQCVQCGSGQSCVNGVCQ